MSSISTNNGMTQGFDQISVNMSETIASYGNYRGGINGETLLGPSTGATFTPTAVCQQIQETSGKRISTLDYLRKV